MITTSIPVPLTPWLSASDAAILARLGAAGDGHFGGISADEIAWGTPLDELLNATGCIGDFLEAAAVAGYTGAVIEGIAMTVRAFTLWCLRQADEDEAQGVLGDALGVGDTRGYRELIALLWQQIAMLESRAAALWRVDTDVDESVMSIEDRAEAASAADRRARLASKRSREVARESAALALDGEVK